MKAAQQEVKHCVKEAKDSYRRKVEQKLRDNNMREVWEGVKTITGLNTKTRAVGGTMERANELNDFFNRFNQPLAPPPPPSPQPSPPLPSTHLPLDTTTPPSSSPTSTQSSPLITTDQVRGQLRKLRPRKAAGPDKVCPRLLKDLRGRTGGTTTTDLQPQPADWESAHPLEDIPHRSSSEEEPAQRAE
ncbi:hypothetical protein L3Q82_005244 [Scortum barcoo]|uniref:Uncharacterized protein n=1 Tax=Scortum barcoo TaxID=214431 RepID=A0ACB8V9E3_9TELE|nr:hypothetical protein L3Q82_005244 [Scortum barcoo]